MRFFQPLQQFGFGRILAETRTHFPLSPGLISIEKPESINGYSAYDPINVDRLMKKLNFWYPTGMNIYVTEEYEFPFLKGINAHYKVMDQNDYLQAMGILK